jgi:hypothetical protein
MVIVVGLPCDNVPVVAVFFAVVEDVVSDAGGWVGWYCVSTDAIGFVRYVESVVVLCCIVSMHRLNLGQSSENFQFVLQFIECFAWFGGLVGGM